MHFISSVQRLRGSRVLLAGLGGLGAEVAKNLILAGVKELTLLDHEQVQHNNNLGCLLISYTNNFLPQICDWTVYSTCSYIGLDSNLLTVHQLVCKIFLCLIFMFIVHVQRKS